MRVREMAEQTEESVLLFILWLPLSSPGAHCALKEEIKHQMLSNTIEEEENRK